MQYIDYLKLKGFYENQLTNQILAFWLPRCLDQEYGGYLNCFDNTGENLVSYDKYTWSQGRFLWMFSRLASSQLRLFTKKQREEFKQLAQSGRDFLINHCLMDTEDMRCVFLMERDGTPKYVDGCNTLDMSIYADCFVVLGMNAYANAFSDQNAYSFAKRLFNSILDRVDKGSFYTLPYPLSKEYRAHGIPMILTNVTTELFESAQKFDAGYCETLKRLLTGFVEDVLFRFADEKGSIHEVIAREGDSVAGLLGQHANPGHTIEDMWFQLDAIDLLGRGELEPRIMQIVLRAVEIGWDAEFGGLLHYVHVNGGPPIGLTVFKKEVTEKQVLSGWGDKLWWIHSEALYTTLLCYVRTGDSRFWQWHEKLFEYTFRVFPNQDPEVREWKQICQRNGCPQEKVVALPVKDPYHITRNLLLTLELLEKVGGLWK